MFNTSLYSDFLFFFIIVFSKPCRTNSRFLVFTPTGGFEGIHGNPTAKRSRLLRLSGRPKGVPRALPGQPRQAFVFVIGFQVFVFFFLVFVFCVFFAFGIDFWKFLFFFFNPQGLWWVLRCSSFCFYLSFVFFP